MLLKTIESKIYEVRSQKVMLDFDLAELYEVETRVLNQAVKRNIDIFPIDFMFQITPIEWDEMSSQLVMTSHSKRPKVSPPSVFTEHGVTMLANVLKSKKARQTSIAIVRAFIALKQYALTNQELSNKLREMEKTYNKQFKDVYEAINYLLQKDKLEVIQKERQQIGYKLSKKK